MSTAADILDALRAWEVPLVFCCPGTTEIPCSMPCPSPSSGVRRPSSC